MTEQLCKAPFDLSTTVQQMHLLRCVIPPMATVKADLPLLPPAQAGRILDFPGKIPDQYTLDHLQLSTTLKQIQQIHARMLKLGLVHNHFTLSKLIQHCTQPPISSMCYANSIFSKIQDPNPFTSNTMIKGFADQNPTHAIAFYIHLLGSGFVPDRYTFPFLIKLCSGFPDCQLGKTIHGQALKSGFSLDLFLQTALVHFYAVFGNLEDACKVFDRIPEKSLVCWNGLISGCCKSGLWEEALEIFQQMRFSNVRPDGYTMVDVARACAQIGSLELGKRMHSFIDKKGIEIDVYVGSALIEMFSKCGCIEKAKQVFDEMPQKNLVVWSSMISALASHGLGDEALTQFASMVTEMAPDDITCVSVLSACSHSGLVGEGERFFAVMWEEYGVMPKLEHYECVVDMYGRAGLLDKAVEIIREMPMEPSAHVWRTLLGACKVHSNVGMAERAMEKLMELEDGDDGDWMVLANVYAHVGRWDDAERVRKEMGERGMKRRPGCSWIEVNNMIHEFYAGEEEFQNLSS